MNPNSVDAVKKASQKAIEILNEGKSGGVQEQPSSTPSLPKASALSSISPAGSDQMSESSSTSSLSRSPEIDISIAADVLQSFRPPSDQMSESSSSTLSLAKSPESDISFASSASVSPAVSDQMSESSSSAFSPFQNLPTMVQTNGTKRRTCQAAISKTRPFFLCNEGKRI